MKRLAPSEAVVKRIEGIEERCNRYIGKMNPWDRHVVSKLIYRKVLPEHKRQQKTNGEMVADLPWKITVYDGEKSAPKVKNQYAFRSRLRDTISSVFSQV
jgi:hypothetical protein